MDRKIPKQFPGSDTRLLASVNFPLYNVQLLDYRHIVVAGGGGEAKTGVQNRIYIYEIREASPDLRLELVAESDTGHMAIMKCGVSVLPLGPYHGADALLATAGQPARIYTIDHRLTNPMIYPQPGGHLDMIECGRLNSSVEIKCIQCCTRRNLILTGAIDGTVTVWKVAVDQTKKSIAQRRNISINNSGQNFGIVAQCRPHSSQIDDIDINPLNGHVVTLCQKEECKILEYIESSKERNIVQIDTIPCTPYTHKFRASRYVKIPRDGQSSAVNNFLYTVSNPPNRLKQSSFLCQWDCSGNKHKLVRQVSIGNDAIMALDVSEFGDFIGVGTALGSVFIYESSKFEQIYSIERAHAIFVTALQFAPLNRESMDLTCSSYCCLFSVSADNHIVMHRPSGNITTQSGVWRRFLLCGFVISLSVMIHSLITLQ